MFCRILLSVSLLFLKYIFSHLVFHSVSTHLSFVNLGQVLSIDLRDVQ